MEILATTEYVGSYWTFVVFLSLISAACIIGFIYMLIRYIEDLDSEHLVMTIIFLLIAVVMGLMANIQYEDGILVEHEVLIEDFNEVYKNGYEIIGQNGEIYTITERE